MSELLQAFAQVTRAHARSLGIDVPESEECSQCYSTPCVCDCDPYTAEEEYERATRHNRG